MANPNTPAPPAKGTELDAPNLSEAVLRSYEAMLSKVPEAGGGGYDTIGAQLATAQSLTDLEAPWRSEGGRAYLGQWLTFTGIEKVPSEYAGGIAWFLVVSASTIPDGEAVRFTTGSVNVVMQLVRAHELDLFPFQAKLVEADRETKSGFRPQRLVFTE